MASLNISKESISMNAPIDNLRPLLSDDRLSKDEKYYLENILRDCERQQGIMRTDYIDGASYDRHLMRAKQSISWYSLISTGFIISLSSFIFGYVTLQSSVIIDPSSPTNTGAINSEFNLTNFQKNSLIPSASLIGASIGSLSMLFYPSLKYGRRTILLLSNIPVIIGCILCIVSVSPNMVIIGFIFEGIGFGISSVVAPILLMELAPTSMRCCFTLFHQLFVTFGILFASISALFFIEKDNGWKYITSIIIIIPILQLIFYKKIPESPRWLIAHFMSKNKDNIESFDDNNAERKQVELIDEQLLNTAKDTINRYFVNQNEAKIEYDDVYLYFKNNLDVVAMDDSFSSNLAQIGVMADFIRPLCIGMALNGFNQCSGINFILYRSQNILNNEKGSDVYLVIFVLYLINFLSTIVCIICARPKGIKNKTMIYIGIFIILFSLIFLGITDLNYDGESNETLIDTLQISKLAFYVMGFAISLGAYMWIVNCELFPFSHRIRFGSICVFIQWSFNAALSLGVNSFLKLLEFGRTNYTDNNSYARLYFAFAVMMIFCMIFVWKFIPETKNKSLETAVKRYNVASGVVFVS
eukprot:277978_1